MLQQFCEIQFMLPKDIKHTTNHYTHTRTRRAGGGGEMRVWHVKYQLYTANYTLYSDKYI